MSEITQETKDELRRLHAAQTEAAKAVAEHEPCAAIVPDDLAAAYECADLALRRAAERHLIPLLDALAAAEAERDRLRVAGNRVLVMAVDAINTGGRIDLHPDEVREILEAALGDAP